MLKKLFLLLAKIELKDAYTVIAIAFAAVILYFISANAPKLYRACEEYYDHFVNRQVLVLSIAILVPLLIRSATIPWNPPPEPEVHDEYGHRLIADTLIKGHLSNPKHELSAAFETIYVLQTPTYSSIYPIGKGIFLALGKLLFQSDWAGVLLEIALMCGALTWMLYGCLPARWAAVGSWIAATSYGLNPQWINSYWGGGTAAFGGALVFGAICRLEQKPSVLMAAVMGLGWTVVWLTRPFEAIPLFLIAWAVIVWNVSRNLSHWRDWRWTAFALVLMQLVALCITLTHNKSVTGLMTMTPYQLSQKLYGVPQSLHLQQTIAQPANLTHEQIAMYRWQREIKEESAQRPLGNAAVAVYRAWEFFISPWFSLPLCFLIFCLKDRFVWLATAILFGIFLWSRLYAFFAPHYIAPYCCLFVYLICRGFMESMSFQLKDFSIGKPLLCFCLIAGVVMGSPGYYMDILTRREMPHPLKAAMRTRTQQMLESVGGRHVVFIEYAPNHSMLDEWVYNSADIDSAKIIWCRNVSAEHKVKVKNYYPNRIFWVAQVSSTRVQGHLDEDTAIKMNFDTIGKPLSKSWSFENQ